ncbi:MAG: hypothetical protein E7670_02970 [Ruminococcaceae bacterium]|nr:hypothetical protein [Oscillospiraceae bacterium]
MKKTKLLLLIAALLVFVTMLNACGTISSVNKFLNKDYNPLEDVYKSESAVSELTGYKVLNSNESFVIFYSDASEILSYKIFSLEANRIIATFTTTDSLYTFDLYDTAPLLLVAQTAKQEDSSAEDIVNGIDAVIDVTYTAYDANGEILKTFEKYKPEAPVRLTFDTCIFDYAAYTIEENGALSKTVDVPEYVALDSIVDWNDDYYYAQNGDTVAVFDHSFNLVSTYVAPSYYEDVSIAILNNGNIFAQYMYEVDEDERKYDLSISENGHTGKYDLVSMIINAKNGKATKVNLDYVVMDVYSNYAVNTYFNSLGETSPYNDKFENIAIIAPIVNKKLDESDANLDIVFMNNKGKAADSLKIADNQVAALDAISKIGNDRYLVETLVGASIIDAKGKVIKNMNNVLDLCSTYFVSDRYIYDLDLEIVYDLVANDAAVLDVVNNTLFVQAETDTGYEIISFCNGAQTTVYTYNNTSNDATVFEIVDGIGYSLINAVSNEYKYYNAEGTLLVTTTYALEAITSADADVVIMKGLALAGDTYHTFSK